jgi:hemerythrin-like domain-containing protein
MTLQEKMIGMIDNHSGIESLVDFLNKFKRTVHESDRIYFNNMIDYFSLLYQQEVPVEQHAVEYKEASLKTISVLKKYNNDNKVEALTFLNDLITFKLEAVSNIKGLAS